MAINFDSLPKGTSFQLPAKGTYYATIEKPEMKQGKDPSKPPYLNFLLNLKTADGKTAGKIFDAMYESNHEVVRYKLRRFIEALKLPIVGAFELSDLCKIINEKQFIVDITHDKSDPVKAIVDVFTNGVYYPLSDASEIFKGTLNTSGEINASDAADANLADSTPFDLTEY